MDNFNKLKKLFFRLGLIGTMIIVTSFSFTNSPIYPASALFMPSSNTALFLPLFEPIVSNHLAISPLDIVWEMIGKVNIDRAQQDLKQLTGEIPLCINAGCYTVTNRLTGSEGLSWAKAYVYSEISKLNFSVTIQDWTRGGYTDQNIIAQKPGVVYPNEKIYFVAHLDGVKSGSSNFPAADDNGSGVVDILELARVLSNYPLMRTVVLLISTGEEEGTLGVQSYLSQLSPGELSAIKKVVNIDMVGYDGNQDKVMELWHGGHSPSIDLTHQMSETIHAYILNLLPGYVVGCG